MSDSLTAIYIEPHWCPLHQSILLTEWPICEIFTKKSWELAILKNALFLSWPFWIFFFQKKKIFFCFIPIKISPNLHGRMDELKFWCFHWFPENSLLCVILRYTVYNQVLFNKVIFNEMDSLFCQLNQNVPSDCNLIYSICKSNCDVQNT